MPALAIDDIGLIAEAIPADERVVLIGERAIEFWISVLGIRNESSGLLKSTIQGETFRLLGPPRVAMSLEQTLGGCVRIAVVEDESSQVTALLAGSSEGRKWAAEFQSGLCGFPQELLEAVRQSAMPLVVAPGRPLRLFALHPVHCLREQLDENYGHPPGRRREPHGECHVACVDLALEACRRITRRHIDEGNVPAAMRIIEALHRISVSPAALRARLSDGVQVDSAMVDSDAFPKEYRRQRLRYFRRIHQRKLHVYRRRFSHLMPCATAQS